jgi:hypothetical protein
VRELVDHVAIVEVNIRRTHQRFERTNVEKGYRLAILRNRRLTSPVRLVFLDEENLAEAVIAQAVGGPPETERKAPNESGLFAPLLIATKYEVSRLTPTRLLPDPRCGWSRMVRL